MKQLTLRAFLCTIFLFLSCSYLLNSEAQNPKPPDKVTLYSPVPGEIYASAALISWTRPKAESFAEYKIFYDTDSEVSEKSTLAASITYKNDTTYLLDGLDDNTRYWVKVFVHNGASYSESNPIDFTTEVCSCGVFTGEKQDGMILLPAGCFIGKDKSIASISHDFYMDTTEVTITEWNTIMSTAHIIDTDYVSINKWEYILNFDTSTSLKPKVEISWYQMIVFCNEKSIKNSTDTCYTYSLLQIDTLGSKITDILDLECDFKKNGFRLPTEDEWEYAYHGGRWEEFYWGKEGYLETEDPFTTNYPTIKEDSVEISEYIWWDYNNNPSGAKEVAKLKPNSWHLYDMGGNVMEAVWDIAAGIERDKSRIDYTWWELGPQISKEAITRGGSYGSKKTYAITAWWRRQSSMDFDCDFNMDVGLRTVRIKAQ